MSKEISCFIRFRHRNQNLANVSVRVLNTDIRATTDEQGIAELRFAENINELILVSLESEEYIESTQTCFAKQYQDKNNPYTILTQLANFAITNLTMYQKQTQDNTTKQTPIYTAQPHTSNNQAQDNNTQTHTNATDSQHLISLQAHIQTLQGGKMSAIQWGYYIKDRNENLKSKITIKDLKSFTFVSNDTYNTKISFEIKAKFTYTITENNTQKEITDYLKDNQQLVIFAYRKSPAYTTSYGTPHTILTISQYPILKLTSKMLTILYTHTNATYTLTHSCDTHYLSQNLKNKRIYTLELRDSNLYIKDKESNKDIALMLTKEIPSIQEKVILLDSKDLQNLQTTLGLHTHRDRVEIYVEVQRAKRPSFESVERAYREITREGASEFIEKYNEILERYRNGEITQEVAKQEITSLRLIMAEARYAKVDDVLLRFYRSDKQNLSNTCATRISYALNHSTISLNEVASKKDLPSGLWDIKGKYYYISVDGIINALSVAWGKPKKLDDNLKQSILQGLSEDFYIEMTNKQQNIALFNDLVSFKRKGIVAMRMQHNSLRHTTLWNGSNFVDVEMNKEIDIPLYLFGYDYLNDPNNDYPHIVQFYFWELK